MCGIAGIIDFTLKDKSVINNMIKSLKHRGPDNIDTYIDMEKGIFFAHSRLSILDLSVLGNQPMESQSGRYVISFNGEIYNHLHLRNKLKNIKWKGNSDTETILGCFDCYGIENTIKHLTGMFSIAVWDKYKNILYLIRDRVGEKPLYYGFINKSFVFASELKAIKIFPNNNLKINRDVLNSFMRFGYISSPFTIYENIFKLPQGSFIKYDLHKYKDVKINYYWSMHDIVINSKKNPFNGDYIEAEKILQNKLSNSVKNQLISDVPIGAFLSGGIDSSLIVSLMQENSIDKIKTFTIGSNEKNYDESNYANKIANHLNTEHTEIVVSSSEAIESIPFMSSVYDEPFADPSQIPTYLVSNLASKTVKVSLSGDGADELFGGYNRYIWLNKINKFPIPLRIIFAKFLNMFNPDQWDFIFDNLTHILPKLLRVSMPGHKAHKLANILLAKNEFDVYEKIISFWENPSELIINSNENKFYRDKFFLFQKLEDIEESMMAFDSISYLADDILCKLDRAAMNFSLETRTPFLDHDIIDFSWKLPKEYKIDLKKGKGKIILRNILKKYCPTNLTERPKMGFGIPLEHWLRGPLKNWALDMLNQNTINNDGFINFNYISKYLEEHFSGKRNWQYHIWNLLMFQSWYKSNS